MTRDELIRPKSLEGGAVYLRVEKSVNSVQPIPVTIIAYDVCPAFVIVREDESRIRCPREEIFEQLIE